ncbi:bifunctional Zinc finger [Babesia duncani]|uniref:RING-type E3 ubiquitin transferase n=1 Tax=Babesia duncani TaxID=323732 RepID=A0AAD9PIZ5_9APIC|nr:bifunctional Zinc finger [Babesia duncani]
MFPGLSNKTTVLFYVELFQDVLSLTSFGIFTLVFFINNPSNVPAYMLIDMLHVAKNLFGRIKMLIHYRHIAKALYKRYPKPTEKEIENGVTCIICRDQLDEDSRKIECGHIYHLRCLKSWLFQHSTCPTCRAPIESEDDASQSSVNIDAASLAINFENSIRGYYRSIRNTIARFIRTLVPHSRYCDDLIEDINVSSLVNATDFVIGKVSNHITCTIGLEQADADNIEATGDAADFKDTSNGDTTRDDTTRDDSTRDGTTRDDSIGDDVVDSGHLNLPKWVLQVNNFTAEYIQTRILATQAQGDVGDLPEATNDDEAKVLEHFTRPTTTVEMSDEDSAAAGIEPVAGANGSEQDSVEDDVASEHLMEKSTDSRLKSRMYARILSMLLSRNLLGSGKHLPIKALQLPLNTTLPPDAKAPDIITRVLQSYLHMMNTCNLAIRSFAELTGDPGIVQELVQFNNKKRGSFKIGTEEILLNDLHQSNPQPENDPVSILVTEESLRIYNDIFKRLSSSYTTALDVIQAAKDKHPRLNVTQKLLLDMATADAIMNFEFTR